jgi:hypothetical protein
MKDRSSIGVGRCCTRMGAFAVKNWGENPIELHLLFVPECELTGRRAKSRRPGSRGSREGENQLGSNQDRPTARQSIFKRLARQRRSSPQQFDRTGLRTAWKYAYLFHADHRITRYVE